MRKLNQMRIEPLGSDPVLFVLRDANGRSLGTGTRDVLEVLLDIANRGAQQRPSLTSPWIVTTPSARQANPRPT